MGLRIFPIRIIFVVVLDWMCPSGVCYRFLNSSEASQDIGWLQIFEPFDIQMHRCELKRDLSDVEWYPHSLDVSTLGHDFGWLLRWDKLSHAIHGQERVDLEYAFVAGDHFDVSAPLGAIGWCYRLSTLKFPEAHKDAICVCGRAAKRQETKKLTGDVDLDVWMQSFLACNAGSTKCDVSPSGNRYRMDFVTGGAGPVQEPLKFQVRWQHPRTLLVDLDNDARCHCEAEYVYARQQLDNSVAHGMSYYVVEGYVRKSSSDDPLIAKATRDHLVWAACFDEEHPVGWFKADTARYALLWKRRKSRQSAHARSQSASGRAVANHVLLHEEGQSKVVQPLGTSL
eukprot:TRINITY_DN5599_c0_g3_i2.p1 TRINITY_DN5599_c0_g3~~TRINITY_DN5599_c0_g3_i2.p1  ORF type:complete len:359 (-),score=20.34 TRINITY_DN5599_c0_g3_i2:735-1757(-)